MTADATFDIIIIGAGTAGCVLANRLSEDRSRSILLLEAGGSDRHPFVRVPAGSGQAIFNPRFNWMYQCEPDESRAGAPEMWPAGKVLGGGSSINGMMFVRGHAYDYDLWAQSGAAGWSYDDVLPYFKRLEANERGGDQWRGGDGPVHVSEVRARSPLTTAWIEAAQNAGINKSADLNGECAEGVDRVQASQKNGWRCSAAVAYLHPAKSRKNLTIWTGASVKRILFDGARAVGVECERGGEEAIVKSNDGIVVSAGSLATPKILKLSGVGSVSELRANGIEVNIEAPAVGENLQEHPAVPMRHLVSAPSIGANENILSNLVHGLNFITRGRGPLSTGIGHAQAFVKTDDSLAAPNVQIIMSPFSIEVDENGPRIYEKASVGIAVGLARTEARGRVLLQSDDWRSPPKIQYKMLSSANDVRQLIEGCKIARTISQTEPFASLHISDEQPDVDIKTDDEWEAYVRNSAFPMYHPCGTCRIGNDDRAVVDSNLKVRGSENLWVVDASVIPTIPAGNINATVFMIGEKGADHIKKSLSSAASERTAA